MREDEDNNCGNSGHGVTMNTARTRGELLLGRSLQVHLLNFNCGGECGGKVAIAIKSHLGVLGYVSIV